MPVYLRQVTRRGRGIDAPIARDLIPLFRRQAKVAQPVLICWTPSTKIPCSANQLWPDDIIYHQLHPVLHLALMPTDAY